MIYICPFQSYMKLFSLKGLFAFLPRHLPLPVKLKLKVLLETEQSGEDETLQWPSSDLQLITTRVINLVLLQLRH